MFSNPAVTGKQATAVGTQRLVLVNTCENVASFTLPDCQLFWQLTAYRCQRYTVLIF